MLQEMHRRVLQDADDSEPRTDTPPPAKAAATTAEPVAQPGPAPHTPAQLPLALSTFTGREPEIEALETLLRSGAC